jgi:iron complex transport system substrate-binding protein
VRVVSQTVGSDELLLAIAEPSQVAALSALSREPIYSAVAAEAKAYPKIGRTADVESVLKYSPTLVLCGDYSRSELVAQLRRAGVKVLVFDRYYSLEDAYSNLRMLAHEIGPTAEARAERIIADDEARVRALSERLRGVRPVRVIAPSTYGIIPGDGSTFQDLCDHTGAENLAYTLGHLHRHAQTPDEQLLTWPVEELVVAGDDIDLALAPFRTLAPYKFMAAVREGRAVLIKPWEMSCVSHHRVEAYEDLARALHPEAFR